ncbi:thyrostimulin alpha-2 subunit-like [Amphibalanus amphitrite]|uniref:thyrostimulin alpha-2 subunit-like n=1 Tax=Amphibalanus amphitrite TaxID=1232801 RepID=UPI001C902DA1|nr:thyrostimulin alpha-2 subunit-like [Amphibalanus amphitrite]XP_043246450.1 thyrostimulin alpha-2 subunit-like [Amphibalanus amphitrite]
MPTGAVLLLAVELTVLSCVLSAHLPHRTQSLELEKIGQLEAFEYDEPSCRLVGHTQRVVVPGCLPLALTVNACQGACESYALPSSWATMKLNPRHLLTSVSQCCNIMETKNVQVELQCANGPKYIDIKSARACACFHCKKA